MIGYIQCIECKWLNHLLDGKTCKAFPNDIPDVIWFGKFDHSKKYPGQGNEVVFEAVEGVDRVDVVD